MQEGIDEEIQELNSKKVTLNKTIAKLKKDADEFAFEAENALKRHAIEREGVKGVLSFLSILLCSFSSLKLQRFSF